MTDRNCLTYWRDIPGFPGYRAKSDGAVWSSRKSKTPVPKWKQLRPVCLRRGIPLLPSFVMVAACISTFIAWCLMRLSARVRRDSSAGTWTAILPTTP